MQVKDAMQTPGARIAPEASLVAAAQLMQAGGLRCLAVCEGETVLGMVTETDLVRKGFAAGKDPAAVICASLMARDAPTCRDSDSLDSVAELMDRRRVHELAVLDAGKRLVGIVTLADLAFRANFERAPPPPMEGDAFEPGGEMSMSIPRPTLADLILRLAARDAWR
jgi:CBS domain-containing protein